MSGGSQIFVRVTAAEPVAEGIRRFRLEPLYGVLPPWSAGAHIVVSMNAAGRTIRNPYSLNGGDPAAFEISVLKTPDSRGGSLFMHDQVQVGDTLQVSSPVNLFMLDLTARKHILIAGGIGVTPIMAMAAQLAAGGAPFELHYAARHRGRAAYCAELADKYGAQLYFDDEGDMLPLNDILANQPLGTHLYVCGPEGMINWVLDTAASAGWPQENLHCERFLAPPAGVPFTVTLANSHKIVAVGEHQSMLEAFEAAGVDAPYLCRGGACGQCMTDVLSCDGKLVHNDHFLSDAERQGGRKILPCVSRFEGASLVLAL